jgi:NAD(P)-dependent dehydrogenase (short-subunit alcohol dehydrogenase family)
VSDEQSLTGKVIAIVGTGADLDRAIAIACAEAGADLALGTESEAREHDYGMNSIANEIWAIGREHFVRVLTGSDDLPDLVQEANARLGRCDLVLCRFEIEEVGGVPAMAPAETHDATLTAIASFLG